MSYGPDLDRLAARWADHPTSTCFAPLAEGLRKSGALDEARAVALGGVTRRPDYLPGHLVLARIYRDQQLWHEAEAELRAALAIDDGHPMVVEAIGRIGRLRGGESVISATRASPGMPASDDESEPLDLVFSDELADEAADEPVEQVITESLAMLYWGQGHHEQALAAFETLIRRNPANEDLILRRDMVRAEFAATRPRPFDSAESGGRSVRNWLASLAAATAPAPRPVSGFDAFYQTPPAPSTESGDLAAFQAWLRELER